MADKKDKKMDLTVDTFTDLVNSAHNRALSELMIAVTKKLDPKLGADPAQSAYIEVLRIANSLRIEKDEDLS